MHRSPTVLVAALLTAGALLTGCTASGSDADTSAETDSSAASGGAAGDDAGDATTGAGRAPAAQAAEPAEGAAAPAEGAAEAPTSVTSGRVAPGAALIRTADLQVRVDDVRAAADEAGRLATGAGGSVESEERSDEGEQGAGSGSAVVVLRVPPRAFPATLSRLADLGEELTRRVGTEDVTDQVVDLETRLATQRASVARVSTLLDRAEGLGEIVKIEGELTRRTADLESLEARLAVLEERTDLSTITARFTGADRPAAAAADPGPRGFGDGLSAGWDALVEVTRGTSLALGALLPFSPLLLVAGVLLWRTRGRRGMQRLPGTAGA